MCTDFSNGASRCQFHVPQGAGSGRTGRTSWKERKAKNGRGEVEKQEEQDEREFGQTERQKESLMEIE